MREQNKIKMLAEGGVMIALSQILSYITFFQMPQGGKVTPGSMVPIILFALIWGGKPGIIASVAYGILQFLLGGAFSLHPLSILLDYIVGFGVLGVAGFFSKDYKGAIAGTIIAVCLRFISSFLSGWLVFGSYAPAGEAPWLYSLVYNATYMVPELIITTVVIALIYKPLKKALKR